MKLKVRLALILFIIIKTHSQDDFDYDETKTEKNEIRFVTEETNSKSSTRNDASVYSVLNEVTVQTVIKLDVNGVEKSSFVNIYSISAVASMSFAFMVAFIIIVLIYRFRKRQQNTRMRNESDLICKQFKISLEITLNKQQTDKLIREAAFHSNSQYMLHVKDFYDKLELNQKVDHRLVYIASDDPRVMSQLKADYPDYEFIGNSEGSKFAEKQNTRYGNNSLWGALTDIFLLSETDYIVCTLSSAVCRASYELMRYSRGDASFSYRSLDVPFAYHFALTPVRTAVYNHKSMAKNQWDLKIGDKLHEKIRSDYWSEWFDQAKEGRGWDSYFYATNSTENQKFYKLYPHYKMDEDIELI